VLLCDWGEPYDENSRVQGFQIWYWKKSRLRDKNKKILLSLKKDASGVLQPKKSGHPWEGSLLYRTFQTGDF